MPEGGVATPEGIHPFTGPITRLGGVIHAGVRVRLDGSAQPDQPTDPEHWTILGVSGPMEIPAVRWPEPEEKEGP